MLLDDSIYPEEKMGIFKYEYDSSSYYYGYQSQSSITGYDAEGQITSAIEYVTMDADELPVIYQITGHNETEIGSNFQSVVSKANANLKSLELFNEEKVPDTDENGPFTTGFAVNDSSTGASIVVFGTPYVVDDSYDNAVSGNNADMFKDVITSMTGNVELASSVIPVKDYTLSNITINTLQAVITGLIIMIAVPILLIIIGIVVWAMRRKK